MPSLGICNLKQWAGQLVTLAAVVMVLSVFTVRAEAEDFNRRIRPILAAKCYACHGPDEYAREAELRLDTFEGATAERDAGQAVVPGSPAESLLLQRIVTLDPDERMPPPDSGEGLTSAEIDQLRQWIASGGTYQRHWSFEPVRPPSLPRVRDASWGTTPIDTFILSRLEAAGIEPAAEASATTLCRRLSLDLVGLPPSPEELDAYLTDTQPGAYERLLDRLLASPRFGERWGRHWLDQARYADSHGYTTDDARSMWPYRDWVIAAFNRDLPFDQFTIEQLAGDLLQEPHLDQLVATGFHRNTLINREGGTKADQFRDEQVKDRVDTTGLVWLGLTVGCARCHAHKFDPISQQEYYQLYAFFNSTADANSVDPTIRVPNLVDRARLDALIAQRDKTQRAWQEDPRRLSEQAAWEAALADDAQEESAQTEIEQADSERQQSDRALADLARIPRNARQPQDQLRLDQAFVAARPSQGQAYQDWQSAKQAVDEFQKSLPTTLVLRELESPRPTHLQIRGDFLRLGPAVAAGVPATLRTTHDSGEKGSRRELARWLVDPTHPLTPRVRVNRIWMRLFGQGLVETENDFGTQGSWPTHPELLDWLAREFVRQRWSTKQLLRTIVCSATYRQASHHRAALQSVDPSNRLLARQNRLRVEAEIVRDAALAVSGLLSPRIGGPSVYPPQPDGVYAFTQAKKQWNASQGDDRYRRGMYTFFYRSAPYPLFTTFDTPQFNQTCTRRGRSNTPLQALTLANSDAVFELACGLALEILREDGWQDGRRLERMFRRCFARPPTAEERSTLLEFLGGQRQYFALDPAAADILVKTAGAVTSGSEPGIASGEWAAWASTARVLMNLDEFYTRE